MASPSELSLDCKPHSYSMLLKSFGDLQSSVDHQNQGYKIEEFLSRLEEERLKIDAFKRELPLCMQLLTNAMEASRQQLDAMRVSNKNKMSEVGAVSRPVLEEFIPMKKQSGLGGSEIISKEIKGGNAGDKASWMTTAQLWSQASEGGKQDTGLGLGLEKKQRKGGAFLPFSKGPASAVRGLPEPEPEPEPETEPEPEPELALAASAGEKRENPNDSGKGSSSSTTTHRKARRCWSPDLHRRFVNALQMLGGSQVATPKQIRELMKVDGLTNDEVKSHLQKYRLHTRRPSPSPQAGAPAPQLVVLGGIWVPPEYATAAGSPALYGAHHHATTHAPPPHYCAAATTPVPQEFYTAAPPQALLPPPPPPQHHLHVYKRGSPESESIEDGKSESSSWKGESEGDRRKGIGEESNGSDITLKF